MLKNYSKRLNYGINQTRPSVNRNLSKLQKTELEPDKSEFTSLQVAKNVIHKGANARVRNGYESLGTVPDLLGIDIHETETNNYLYAIAKDGETDSKVVHVNRDTGVNTDIVTGITGQTAPDSTSLSNFYYVCNGSDTIRKFTHDGTTDTDMTLPDETVKLITNDGSRLWFVTDTGDGEVLRFSQKYITGDVINLKTVSSTLLNRAGVAESNISKFTSLERSGDRIIATGENLTEVFRIPDFGSVTEFTADVPVRIAAFPNIGVKSKGGIKVVGSYAYLKPEDGIVIRLSVVAGASGYSQKQYQDDLLQMESLNFDNVAMGYDSRSNILMMSCRDSENNDRVVAFNIFDETFSLFDNIFSTEWSGDADNLYFWDNDTVFDAFQEGVMTDAGLPIDVEVVTQMTNFGDEYNYKKLHNFYLNIEFNEDLNVVVDLYADRAVNGVFNPNISRDITLGTADDNLLETNQSFGLGVWGASGVSFDETQDEILFTQNKVPLSGNRFEMGVKFSTSSKASIRGLGITAFPTNRQTKTLTYK